MSDIVHQPEHTKAPDRNAAIQKARETAAAYARLFLGSEDGKRVLADLRAKFGLERAVFVAGEHGKYDTISAALREGERHVMADIEAALRIGAPDQGLSEKTKP